MSIIDDIIKPEYYRLLESIQFLQNKINEFPKGASRVKVIKGRNYLYLTYREGEKVKSKYIGSLSSKKAVLTLSAIKKRDKLHRFQKELKIQLRDAKKVLGNKV